MVNFLVYKNQVDRLREQREEEEKTALTKCWNALAI